MNRPQICVIIVIVSIVGDAIITYLFVAEKIGFTVFIIIFLVLKIFCFVGLLTAIKHPKTDLPLQHQELQQQQAVYQQISGTPGRLNQSSTEGGGFPLRSTGFNQPPTVSVGYVGGGYTKPSTRDEQDDDHDQPPPYHVAVGNGFDQ